MSLKKKLIAWIGLVLIIALVGYAISRITGSKSADVLVTANATAPLASVNYSLDDIKKHASVDDCWTVVSGKVYDLTTYASKHPGGNQVAQMCGKEATAIYDDQHLGQKKPSDALAGFKIGDLK